MTLRVDSLGYERFVRAFNRIPDNVKDFREPLTEIYQDFLGIERRNFSARGRPEAWRPLSPKYAAWKARHFPGKPLLELTGNLKASLLGSGAAAVRDIRETRATFGTAVRHAIFHQLGTRRMPRRKPVQIADEDKVRWGRIVHVWAVKQAQGTLRGAT
jgi:phage gpG-like protein